MENQGEDMRWFRSASSVPLRLASTPSMSGIATLRLAVRDRRWRGWAFFLENLQMGATPPICHAPIPLRVPWSRSSPGRQPRQSPPDSDSPPEVSPARGLLVYLMHVTRTEPGPHTRTAGTTRIATYYKSVQTGPMIARRIGNYCI